MTRASEQAVGEQLVAPLGVGYPSAPGTLAHKAVRIEGEPVVAAAGRSAHRVLTIGWLALATQAYERTKM